MTKLNPKFETITFPKNLQNFYNQRRDAKERKRKEMTMVGQQKIRKKSTTYLFATFTNLPIEDGPKSSFQTLPFLLSREKTGPFSSLLFLLFPSVRNSFECKCLRMEGETGGNGSE